MWYLFDKDNKCYGTTNIEPDKNDLTNSNSKAVESDIAYADFTKLSLSANEIVETNLTTEEIKQQNLSALEVSYQPQFRALATSLGLATLSGDQTVIDGIKSDYTELKAEYQTKLEAINNG